MSRRSLSTRPHRWIEAYGRDVPESDLDIPRSYVEFTDPADADQRLRASGYGVRVSFHCFKSSVR